MIPLNKPTAVGAELRNIAAAIEASRLSGDGPFTRECQERLAARMGGAALLTHSCTAALEMAALLADLGPGDEAILPSYTFVSTANAVALRGATPVFVDIQADTLNIDPAEIERALTSRTKAILAVHYAGAPADMDAINALARPRGVAVIEDAAQAYLSTYKGRPAGALGDFGCFSFHETKNILSGEGGALIVRDPEHAKRAEIIWEKGTNRKQFFRGVVDKYTWVDVGSSYLPSELVAAFLAAQLDQAEAVTARRLEIWRRYHDAFAELDRKGLARRPIIAPDVKHNAHMYFLLLNDLAERQRFLEHLRQRGVMATFHYVPLHNSPAGRRYGRADGKMDNTMAAGERLARLPLYFSLSEVEQDAVIAAVTDFFA